MALAVLVPQCGCCAEQEEVEFTEQLGALRVGSSLDEELNTATAAPEFDDQAQPGLTGAKQPTAVPEPPDVPLGKPEPVAPLALEGGTNGNGTGAPAKLGDANQPKDNGNGHGADVVGADVGTAKADALPAVSEEPPAFTSAGGHAPAAGGGTPPHVPPPVAPPAAEAAPAPSIPACYTDESMASIVASGTHDEQPQPHKEAEGGLSDNATTADTDSGWGWRVNEMLADWEKRFHKLTDPGAQAQTPGMGWRVNDKLAKFEASFASWRSK